jgi:hypothetical protein
MDVVKKKTKKRKIKKPTVWSNFSKYIRLRDCLATTGTTDYGTCVTCGRRFHYKKLQAGHAIGGRSNSILFDEELVNAQCYMCNMYGNGRGAEYSVWFIKKYGIEKWEEKIRIARQVGVKLDLEEINRKYKRKIGELLDKCDTL